jgi:hypothetical protein
LIRNPVHHHSIVEGWTFVLFFCFCRRRTHLSSLLFSFLICYHWTDNTNALILFLLDGLCVEINIRRKREKIDTFHRSLSLSCCFFSAERNINRRAHPFFCYTVLLKSNRLNTKQSSEWNQLLLSLSFFLVALQSIKVDSSYYFFDYIVFLIFSSWLLFT